jgi:hypothetical protein
MTRDLLLESEHPIPNAVSLLNMHGGSLAWVIGLGDRILIQRLRLSKSTAMAIVAIRGRPTLLQSRHTFLMTASRHTIIPWRMTAAGKRC